MNNVHGKLYISAAFFLAGSSVVAAGYVASVLGPFTITALSLAFATLTVLILGNTRLLSVGKTISRKQWRAFFWQALVGVFLFRVLLTFGLQHTSAAEAGILIGTTPAITAVLTRFLLREALHWNKIAGIAFTLLGIAVLQGFPFSLGAFNLAHLFGNSLVLGAAACEAVFVLIARNLTLHEPHPAGPLNPILHSGYVSMIALVICLPLMIWEGQTHILASLSPGGWLALVWYGAMVTVIAFACMFRGARTCDGYTLAAFSGLIPVSALALSVVILGETVAPHHIVGCVCIVVAILLMNRR